MTTAGCILLILALGAQALNHWRQDLAEVAPIAPAVKGLFAALGRPIEPRWDVRAYEVRRVGEAALRGLDHNIVLRASVHNTARIAQPLPLLRVTLQDLNGNDIGLRDVEPSEYLAHAPEGSHPQELAPDERVDAEIVVLDAAKKAEGFELDACLRSAAGALLCASSQAALAAAR